MVPRQLFLKDVKRTLLLLFASAGNPAASRTRELLARAREMGRETVLITDDDTLRGDYTFRLPPAVSFLFPPMAAFLVPALVAGYLAALCGEPFAGRMPVSGAKIRGCFRPQRASSC